MPLLLQVLPLLAGCSAAPEAPTVPLEDAVASVSDHLRATGAVTDRQQALTALAAARAEFESQVEPRLRQSRDPLDVAATEYGFARVHRALADGGDAGTEIEILVRRLQPKRGR
jgi:hypothetical protein